jgi:XTP/dITP diphosphohydrolase
MIYFVTSNKHKFQQAERIFSENNIRIKWIKRSYDEASDDTIEQIAEKAAKKLANDLNKPIMVEDTGFFFEAYPGFPGAFPKFVFNHIGYEGIFRLLKGKSTKGKFISCVGYCEPNKKPIIFKGELKGKIILNVHCKNEDVMPYERIFIPEEQTVVMGKLSLDEKLRISHRGQSLRKLARFLTK